MDFFILCLDVAEYLVVGVVGLFELTNLGFYDCMGFLIFLEELCVFTVVVLDISDDFLCGLRSICCH